jgi:hypothetical protein
MTVRLALLTGLLASLAPHLGALEWKAESVTVNTLPFQVTQDVVFEFTNHSAKPVRLIDLQTNCDCLDAKADREIYAPGAAGTIRASFTIGDREGLYERTITVVTDETAPAVRLLVRIEVPALTQLAPRSVSWAVNSAPDEKTVELTAAAGLAINFTEAQPTNDAFAVRLETVVSGRHYRLHLRPRDTATPASAAIRVFGRDRGGHEVVASAYANVE